MPIFSFYFQHAQSACTVNFYAMSDNLILLKKKIKVVPGNIFYYQSRFL